jgi:hypothetical protein
VAPRFFKTTKLFIENPADRQKHRVTLFLAPAKINRLLIWRADLFVYRRLYSFQSKGRITGSRPYKNMNTETEYLKSIAEEIAANKTGTNKPNHHLLTEAKRLEKDITHHLTSIENFTQRDTFHFNSLSKLVNICDILFDINETITPDVNIIIDLLTVVKQVIPDEIRPNLKLPKAFVTLQHKKSWVHHCELMHQHQVDARLIEIAGIPFQRFIKAEQKLCWCDFTWLKGYQAKLDILDWENADCNSPTEALMSLLIGRDFNHDSFYVYCKKYIAKRAKAVTGKRNRLLAYAECEKLVLEDTQTGVASYDFRANSVNTRLTKFIREEIDFVETHEREVPHAKLSFQFYKYTLAFFFKLLHEQKVFGDISFRELSEQIASTCTAMGADVPADSVVKKAYLKKQVDFARMESLLVNMLAYVRRFIG